MTINKVPEYCKNCALLWLHGAKDGKHDRHCCHFGKPAPKVWKHCKENGGKVSTVEVTGVPALSARPVDRNVMRLVATE